MKFLLSGRKAGSEASDLIGTELQSGLLRSNEGTIKLSFRNGKGFERGYLLPVACHKVFLEDWQKGIVDRYSWYDDETGMKYVCTFWRDEDGTLRKKEFELPPFHKLVGSGADAVVEEIEGELERVTGEVRRIAEDARSRSSRR